jgi:hypothetical protein
VEGDLMGSSSSSESASSQSTTSQDQRVVADGGSVGVSGSTGNTVNITDGGLIEKGLAFLTGAEEANTSRLQLMLDAGGKLVQANNAITAQALEAKKAADTPASSDASSKTALYIAMLAAGIILMKGKA